MLSALPRSFYQRDTSIVAKELLGKVLVRELNGTILKGKIVETEAYFGPEDPASRAFGKCYENAGMAKQMFYEVGTAFVYMVHNNWLFNVVARSEKELAGAVLIRALEPIAGIEQMFKNRRLPDSKSGNVRELCSGPGKLTKALAIEKKHSGLDLTAGKEIWIESQDSEIGESEIASSHRIGVSKDLPTKLRFYIKQNLFVSRRR